MKYAEDLRMPRSFILIGLGLMVLASVPMLSRAHTASSVNVTNNSGRDIRSIYTSHVNADDWGSNLLASTLAAGQSATVNFNCDSGQIKVIAEDQDGCFETTIINCGDNASWTITSDTARDCG